MGKSNVKLWYSSYLGRWISLDPKKSKANVAKYHEKSSRRIALRDLCFHILRWEMGYSEAMIYRLFTGSKKPNLQRQTARHKAAYLKSKASGFRRGRYSINQLQSPESEMEGFDLVYEAAVKELKKKAIDLMIEAKKVASS